MTDKMTDMSKMTDIPELTPRVMTRSEELAAWLLEAVGQAPAAILLDVETTGLRTHQDKLVLVQVGVVGGDGNVHGVVMDWRRRNAPAVFRPSDPLSYAPAFWEQFNLLFSLPGVPVVGHNVTFDLTVLAAHGFAIPPLVFDTMLAEQVLTGGLADGGCGLAATVERRLDVTLSKVERSYFIGLDERPDEWDAPLPDAQLRYAARDIAVLAPLWQTQQAELAQRELTDVAALEMGAVPAVVAMQHAGVLIDTDAWRAVIDEQQTLAETLGDQVLADFGPALLAARQRAYDALAPAYNAWSAEHAALVSALKTQWEALPTEERPAWGVYKREGEAAWLEEHPVPPAPPCDTRLPNFASVQQLQQAFEALGIELSSTGEEAVGKYCRHLPAGDLNRARLDRLLAWRGARKLVAAYGEQLLDRRAHDGRLHPTYRLIGATTGRMSCAAPNWQQVPRRGVGARLRQAVVAAPGAALITADYANIEMWCLAAISGDERMLEALASGRDLHTETARAMFDLDASWDKAKASREVWQQGRSYRDAGKALNFLLVYGGSAYGLAQRLDLAVVDAEELMDRYFAAFPGVTAWMEERRADVYDLPLAQTVLGRVRYFVTPPLRAYPTATEERDDRRAWETLERAALNAPIQGTSADITKLALGELYRGFVARGKAATNKASGKRCWKLVTVVHDEIVLEAPADEADAASAFLTQTMQAAALTVLRRVRPELEMPAPTATVSQSWEK